MKRKIHDEENGHLSIQECGDILNIGYRGFLKLLFRCDIPIDGLNEEELALSLNYEN